MDLGGLSHQGQRSAPAGALAHGTDPTTSDVDSGERRKVRQRLDSEIEWIPRKSERAANPRLWGGPQPVPSSTHRTTPGRTFCAVVGAFIRVPRDGVASKEEQRTRAFTSATLGHWVRGRSTRDLAASHPPVGGAARLDA